MNRRTFFRNLALAAVAVPAAVVAAPPKRHRKFTHVASIPPEAGKVNCMAIFRDHAFIGCDNGLWTMPVGEVPETRP